MLLRAPIAVVLPSDAPLSSAEVLEILRQRWQASYDLQLIVRRGRLYLQVMWGYLEQQSFPMTAEALHGQARGTGGQSQWPWGGGARCAPGCCTTSDKPRLGKAMTLPLELPRGPCQRISDLGALHNPRQANPHQVEGRDGAAEQQHRDRVGGGGEHGSGQGGGHHHEAPG